LEILVVLGQYEGYTDDPIITNKDSNTPTYATVCLYVNTPRWEGVPFILKAGKALDERKAEVRIQFKDAPTSSFLFEGLCQRNELVIQIQPNEAIYMKTNVKSPGYSSAPVQSEVETNYDTRFSILPQKGVLTPALSTWQPFPQHEQSLDGHCTMQQTHALSVFPSTCFGHCLDL
jgi:glucose-6-phosphate 1-dehydrogenase